MEIMTVEQAREWGKTLTFEDVWAALMETRARQERDAEEARARWAKEDARRAEEDARRAKEDARRAEADARRAKEDAQWAELKEYQREVSEEIRNLGKNLGGLGNTLGTMIEGIYTAKLGPKFDIFGHTFTKVSNRVSYYRDDRKKLCEVDAFLENGDFVMAVEVKAECEMRDINDHLKRLEKIRMHFNKIGDKRKILGCIAACLISDNLIKAAEEHGLYVIVQTGENVEILEKPGEFTEGVW
jgi:hypothetical protein